MPARYTIADIQRALRAMPGVTVREFGPYRDTFVFEAEYCWREPVPIGGTWGWPSRWPGAPPQSVYKLTELRWSRVIMVEATDTHRAFLKGHEWGQWGPDEEFELIRFTALMPPGYDMSFTLAGPGAFPYASASYPVPSLVFHMQASEFMRCLGDGFPLHRLRGEGSTRFMLERGATPSCRRG